MALAIDLTLACCATQAQSQDPYGGAGQPFTPQPRFNPYNYLMPGPPADLGTVTRPSGWPGSPPPQDPPRRYARAAPPRRRTPQPPARRAQHLANKRLRASPGRNLPAVRQARAPTGWTSRNRCSTTRSISTAPASSRRVGPEVIQENEINGYVEEVMQANASKIPKNQAAQFREKLMRDRLNHLIEVKLAIVDAQRKVPPDAYPKIVEDLGGQFEKSMVKKKLKDMNLTSRIDLDEKLRERGTTLEREKQAFIEQQLAYGWIAQQTKSKHDPSHQDMVAYYLEHLDKYSFPAKARWEEIRLRVTNYPSREAACYALGALGNAVVRGAKFADVARARSQGPTASIGGQYDWTSQGSLALSIIDQSLFSLNVGQLSPILDDGRSPTISIVRVIERTDAGREEFSEVQDEIKEKLMEAHRAKDKDKIHVYIEKLRRDEDLDDLRRPAADRSSRGPSAGPGSDPVDLHAPEHIQRPGNAG